MSLLQLFGKKDKPELRRIVETDVPSYKDTLPDHTNRTVPIMNALQSDKNQKPFQIFLEASQDRPKYAVSAQLTKSIEGSSNATISLIGGMSFTSEDEVLVNTVSGELEGKPVYAIGEKTFDTLFEYTKEYIEAQLAQRKERLEFPETETESEPKSNY